MLLGHLYFCSDESSIGLTLSWVEKKVFIAFLIDYLESRGLEETVFKKCEHRLCVGAKLTSLLPGHILWRERSASCLLFYVSWKPRGCRSLGVEPESRGSPARVWRGCKSVGTAATELIHFYSSWSGFRNVWPCPSLCLAPSLLDSEHSGWK